MLPIDNTSSYYLPAEWQKQQAIQLTWPHTTNDWSNSNIVNYLIDIDQYFIKLAQSILNYQDLIIAAENEESKDNIEKKLNKNYPFNLHVYISTSNGTWARDHGPITMLPKTTGKKLILDFEFNAWGGKFGYTKDNAVTKHLYHQAAFNSADYKKIDYILEGGAIECNGEGVLLTTASCLFNQNRNHQMTKQQTIDDLKQYLNVNNLVVIENSMLYGDDTDGHIDMLARFCNRDTILYTACDDQSNPNYANLKKLEQELLVLQKSNGIIDGLKLIPLYIPKVIHNAEKLKNNIPDNVLPASYANFLILNGAVLVPIYNDPKYDQLALDTLSQAFPNRDILGLDSRIVIEQGGSLHCLTMQIPD